MTQQAADAGPLCGFRILVVEDEYFLADDIVRALKALGADIVGPIGELEQATEVVEGDIAIDAAILDVNVESQMVFPLARLLRARNVPFVFTTGYDRTSIEAEFHDIRLWEKPLDVTALARELTNLIKIRPL